MHVTYRGYQLVSGKYWRLETHGLIVEPYTYKFMWPSHVSLGPEAIHDVYRPTNQEE